MLLCLDMLSSLPSASPLHYWFDHKKSWPKPWNPWWGAQLCWKSHCFFSVLNSSSLSAISPLFMTSNKVNSSGSQLICGHCMFGWYLIKYCGLEVRPQWLSIMRVRCVRHGQTVMVLVMCVLLTQSARAGTSPWPHWPHLSLPEIASAKSECKSAWTLAAISIHTTSAYKHRWLDSMSAFIMRQKTESMVVKVFGHSLSHWLIVSFSVCLPLCHLSDSFSSISLNLSLILCQRSLLWSIVIHKIFCYVCLIIGTLHSVSACSGSSIFCIAGGNCLNTLHLIDLRLCRLYTGVTRDIHDGYRNRFFFLLRSKYTTCLSTHNSFFSVITWHAAGGMWHFLPGSERQRAGWSAQLKQCFWKNCEIFRMKMNYIKMSGRQRDTERGGGGGGGGQFRLFSIAHSLPGREDHQFSPSN